MTLYQRDWDKPFSTATAREKVRQLEADLLDQGVAVFPTGSAGARAQALWQKIGQHLLRGRAVEPTLSASGLSWHRQELKRARDVLVEMGLVRRRADGLYVLGHYDRLDELVRDQFMQLKALEGVMVALGGLMPKSKTQKKP